MDVSYGFRQDTEREGILGSAVGNPVPEPRLVVQTLSNSDEPNAKRL